LRHIRAVDCRLPLKLKLPNSLDILAILFNAYYHSSLPAASRNNAARDKENACCG
jgi:hypothetical protein